MMDLWYKNAIVYCLDVETFMDGNGDGVGDFAGLTHRLDHIAALGATCVWLLPFYASPNRDNGYDVTDYYAIHPRLGTLGDFVEFTHLAKDRGLRVIADLPVNHTSTDHPWFQDSRRDPASRYRDWYYWTERRPENHDEGMVFPGVQKTTWTHDPVAGAYYFHRFYPHEADLKTENPAVREEIQRIMGFWLQLGVSGFRIDAAPFLIEEVGVDGPGPLRFEFLEEFRHFLSWRKGDAVMLAEANVTPDAARDFFGDGDRMHMMFNFHVNQRLFLALATERAAPIATALGDLPPLDVRSQWANFLRNHDELDLGRLPDDEEALVKDRFAPEPGMRLYERGIRRRLAPMLDGNARRLKLANSLMLTLPGTPVIWAGDEIGMGDDLSQDERNSVRTPMQWSDGRNGGFSAADPDRVVRPVIATGPFAHDRVNVAAQQRDPDSLLNWFERACRARRDCPELGWGDWRLLETGDPAVLAHAARWRDNRIVIVHNLSGEAREVTIPDLAGPDDHVLEVFCDGRRGADPEPGKPLSLEPYGFRWLRTAGTRR